MRSGKLGQLLGRDPDTIINWTRRPELSKFFSAGVMVKNGQRDFNDADVLLANTIRAFIGEGLSWVDIAAKLEAGERVLEFPPSAAGVEGITPVEVYGAGVASAAQLKEAQNRIRELEEKIDELQEKRMTEKNDLYMQLGEYKARLEDARAEIERLKKAGGNPT
jgi:DNA-binding transcriptional MerR regulator